MIISGLQTGNTRWLAAHLQNAADNESVGLAEIRGTVAQDIDGALAEFDAITAGTKATEGVYAAFINPPAPLTREQFLRAVELVEERLGLTGQPRIILFHVKNGRHHCHVAWSRIDADRMRAIHLSHDRMKLRKCAQELGAMFGLELPFGLRENRGAARFALPRQPTKAEKAQEAHSGITAEERRDAITAAWRKADMAETFVSALEEAGYTLARGDSRAFVVIDTAGDVHSLARQIDGVKTKDIKARLTALNLPSVETARVLMSQKLSAVQAANREDAKKTAAAEAAVETLQQIQRKRRAALDVLWQAMKIRQMHERKVLLAHCMAEKERKLARRIWEAWGLAVYLKKIAVLRQLIEYYQRKRSRTLEEYHTALQGALKRRHENEALELRRRYGALARLARRERSTFAKRNQGKGKPEDCPVEATDEGHFQPHSKESSPKKETIDAAITAAATEEGPSNIIVSFRINTADIVHMIAPETLDFLRDNAGDITAFAQKMSRTLPGRTKSSYLSSADHHRVGF